MATQSLILTSKLEVFYRYFFHFVGSKYSSLYFASEVPFALPRAFKQRNTGASRVSLRKRTTFAHTCASVGEDGAII